MSSTDSDDTAPELTLGRDPDALGETVPLPPGALDDGCYVAGNRDRRTAIVQRWCVELAAAGHGFCYIHPSDPMPRDLLARLPQERLEDVVWIDAGRWQVASKLDVPAVERVAVNPFEAPPDRDAFTTDPVATRVNAYMDAATVWDRFDAAVAPILSAILPALFEGEEPYYEYPAALREADFRDSFEPLKELDALDSLTPFELAQTREGQPVRLAASLISGPLDPGPSNPLLGDSTYDPARALTENEIILITGDIDPFKETDPTMDGTIATHLLVAAVCCRLWEGAQTTATERTFPVVVDGVDTLVPGDGDLFRKLLADPVSLAPVYAGPPARTLAEPVHISVEEHIETRVGVTDGAGSGPESRDRDQDLKAALSNGSLDAAEHYFDQEEAGTVGEGPLCWLRTNAAGRLVGPEGVQQSMRPALAPDPPDTRRGQEAVAAAITRSIDRYGGELQTVSEESKTRARERYNDSSR